MFQVKIPGKLLVEIEDAIQAVPRLEADPTLFVLSAIQFALLSLREDKDAVMVGLSDD
jgi:hypothetical protein